jgi:hypothetical protein
MPCSPPRRSCASRRRRSPARHSAVPEVFCTDVVEPLVRGPEIEMFARHRRLGWDALRRQLPWSSYALVAAPG